jgi:hypothetical protein
MPPTRVHFNGSVNLADAETVMREIVSRNPAGVQRIPDGETGERDNWIGFQLQKFMQSPYLEPAGAHDNPGTGYQQMPQVRLAAGVSPDDVQWPDPGYADAYLGSYAVFRRLAADGIIPAGVRFQAQYPTPQASMSAWVVAEQADELLGSYERALFADLDRFLAEVPQDQVAVQWDVAVEVGILERGFSGDGPEAFDSIVARLARCLDRVPDDVPAGMHLCYGDYGHQHFAQPESIGLQVRLLNEVAEAARRPVDFVSFTVPQHRRDASYFAPLAALAAGSQTGLYFALVPYHPADQAPGTTAEQIRLIDEGLAASPAGHRSWGVCTECGMGRAARQEIPELLDLHQEIIAAAAAAR